jgi:hypothetical protein
MITFEQTQQFNIELASQTLRDFKYAICWGLRLLRCAALPLKPENGDTTSSITQSKP